MKGLLNIDVAWAGLGWFIYVPGAKNGFYCPRFISPAGPREYYWEEMTLLLLLRLEAFPIDYIREPSEPELLESFTA